MKRPDLKTVRAFADRFSPSNVLARLTRCATSLRDDPTCRRRAIIVLSVVLALGLAMVIGQALRVAPPSPDPTGIALDSLAAQMADVPAAAIARGGELIDGVNDAMQTINPLFSTGEGECDAVALIFEPLVRLLDDGSPEGVLALDWSFDAGSRQLLFHLRTDHTFRDGRIVDAADVVFTYQCLLSSSYDGPLQGRFAAIRSVAAGAEPDEIVFTLDSSDESPDFDLFTIGILKSDYYAVDLTQVFSMLDSPLQPEGSGAYALASWQADEAVLALRSGYGNAVKTIVIRQVDDEDEYQLLSSGAIDIARAEWNTRLQLRTAQLDGYALTRFASGASDYFLVNPALVPGNTVQLPSQRLAVLLTAAGDTLSDLQRRALADLAGRSLTLYCFAGLDADNAELHASLAAEIAARLQKAGLQVATQALAWPELAARASEGDYDILLLPATANNRLPLGTVIAEDPIQPSATAWVAGYESEVYIVSNRLAQLTVSRLDRPLTSQVGSWTARLDNVRILAEDGTYWEGD